MHLYLPICVFSWFSLTVLAEIFSIGINPNSSVAPNIRSIVHDSNQRHIIIQLSPIRRVENPTFLVRISGTAVYLLKLVDHKIDKLIKHSVANFFSPRKNIYHFSYPSIVDPGEYFVEILVLFVTEFDPSDYSNICLEDFENGANIVGLPYSFHVLSVEPTTKPFPRWAHVMRTDPTHKAMMLPTRYQPRNCGKRPGELCQSTILDLWQYNSYDWVDQPNYKPLLRLLTKAINVCFVGASHSREMTYHAQQFGVSGQLRFTFVDSKFPSEFSLAVLDQHACDYSIIGYGQWPAFVSIPAPYTADRFTAEIRQVMKQVAGSTRRAQTFFVSTNYNGNHLVVLSCPPFDFHSPPVIDMMNDILLRLSAELDMNYIDMNHIMVQRTWGLCEIPHKIIATPEERCSMPR